MRYFVYELAIMRNVCKSEHTYYYCLMCVYARLGLTVTVELVLGKMKRVGENFSYPFYAIKAAMLSLLVFL